MIVSGATCPECGTDLPPTSAGHEATCPDCGAQTTLGGELGYPPERPQATPPSGSGLLPVALSAVALLVLAGATAAVLWLIFG